MADAPFDVPRAHRWFAVEFNNASWDLLEKGDRSEAETERMLHLAHAAALHWSEVGKPINRERADCLLATAYLAAGRLEPALHYLSSGLSLSDAGVEGETAFDRAGLLACAAKLHARRGDAPQHDHCAKLARAAFDALTDAEERKVITKLYGVV